ncbi:MAG: 4Fe-4S binding protein, partial [Lachnospiraceae bacterium]
RADSGLSPVRNVRRQAHDIQGAAALSLSSMRQPLSQKGETMKAHIDKTKCVGCGACILHCPAHAITMQKNWHACVDASKCTGCGTCVSLCHRHAPYFQKMNCQRIIE